MGRLNITKLKLKELLDSLTPKQLFVITQSFGDRNLMENNTTMLEKKFIINIINWMKEEQDPIWLKLS